MTRGLQSQLTSNPVFYHLLLPASQLPAPPATTGTQAPGWGLGVKQEDLGLGLLMLVELWDWASFIPQVPPSTRDYNIK